MLAWWALLALRTSVAERLPIARLEQVGIDGTVLLFTLATALISAIVFGIAPALTSAGAKLTDTLKDGGRSGSAGRGARIRSAFVVVEVALALILLVGAGLLLRSFVTLLRVDPGFDPAQTITMKVSIPTSKYTDAAHRQTFFNQLFERLDALPGVVATGGNSFLPMAGLGSATSFEIVGQPKPAAGQAPVTDVRVVDPQLFPGDGRAAAARTRVRPPRRRNGDSSRHRQPDAGEPAFPGRGRDWQEHHRRLERRGPG